MTIPYNAYKSYSNQSIVRLICLISFESTDR